MNSQNSNNLSSRSGRQWLRNLNQSGEERVAAQNSEIVSVLIPDVGPNTAAKFSVKNAAGDVDHETLAAVLAEASDSRLVGLENKATEIPVEQPNLKAFVIDPPTEVNQEVVNDISEKPADWLEKVEQGQVKRPTPVTAPDNDSKENAAIQPLVDSVLKRFPLDDPTILLFVGSEQNIHTDETCARVSDMLSQKNIGKVLLIDSDLNTQELSKASGLHGQDGISDVFNKGVAWKAVIHQGSSHQLDFIPAGSIPFEKRRSRTEFLEALAQMKKEYQFICVCGGDAHNDAANFWGEFCDGSYLLVNLKNTHEVFAKSAVAELQANGARLLGCIVTDSE